MSDQPRVMGWRKLQDEANTEAICLLAGSSDALLSSAFAAALAGVSSRVINDVGWTTPGGAIDYALTCVLELDKLLRAAGAAGGETMRLVPVSALDSAKDALRDSANTYRLYAGLHSDKGTADGDRKATANALAAVRCEAALEKLQKLEGQP